MSMQKPLHDAQNIYKHADIIQVQWNNHSRTGNIYNKVSNTKQTRGAYSTKYTNI